ncbi:hypothetical protein CC78DRAFT_586486 [Lojkania enalia]|uniref:Uncharacterized protein n=1 Tax=Lojkania enalia TaxID=147567 RepID=A0A9P4JYZ1_9PLEO|nr:hypothetical protein CC78DRAFT_586486 [Didymosphaeria enalia]
MNSNSDVDIKVRGHFIDASRYQPNISRTRLSNQDSNDLDEFCKRCDRINWSEIERSRPKKQSGHMIATVVETHYQLRDSPRQICQLLTLIKPAVLASTKLKKQRLQFEDTTLVGITPFGKNHRSDEEAGFFAIMNMFRNDTERGFRT